MINIHYAQLPAYIRAEILQLMKLTEAHELQKLRARRDNNRGVLVDIYHHSKGTDSYYCDIRKQYFTWREVENQANIKILEGQILFSAVLEYKAGVHFVNNKERLKQLN